MPRKHLDSKPDDQVEKPTQETSSLAPKTQSLSTSVTQSAAWLLAESERTMLDAMQKNNIEAKTAVQEMLDDNDFKNHGKLAEALRVSIDELRSMIKTESSQEFREAINTLIQEREGLKTKVYAQAQEKWIEEKVSGTWAPSNHLQVMAQQGRWNQWFKRAF
jgi:anaerobic ribonucleoside-triphosphate reductase